MLSFRELKSSRVTQSALVLLACSTVFSINQQQWHLHVLVDNFSDAFKNLVKKFNC